MVYCTEYFVPHIHYESNLKTDLYVSTFLQQFVNTQMMVQTEPKALRASRRSDIHSDKVIRRQQFSL